MPRPVDASPADAPVAPSPQDERTLGQLYVRHWAELCAYVRRTFGSGPPDPQDVVQQTFLHCAALGDSDVVRNPRAYLYRTARNIVVDERRRRAVSRNAAAEVEVIGSHGVDEFRPERILVAEERLQLIRAVIQQQPEARRRSFLLNRLEGLNCAEIARQTGYSESAVKKHIALVMVDLESALARAESTAGREGHGGSPDGP